MEIGDWITLSAVLVALGLGVSSLVQTKRIQKRERRERLLNELIEWAAKTAIFNLDLDKTILSEQTGTDSFKTVSGKQLLSNFQTTWERSKYNIEIAKINTEVNKAVKDAKENLRSIINLLDQVFLKMELSAEPVNDLEEGLKLAGSNLNELEDLRGELTKSLNETIKKATELKLI